MITIKGIYDGINIVPLEQIPTHAVSRVTITFLEETVDFKETELQHYAATSNFNFWGNEREETDSLSDK